jgi:hypothetical protein
MKAKGPRYQRETTINFNEESDTATIWTASQPVYRKLIKLGYQPKQDGERSATFEVPKSLVAVKRPRVLSEKQQQVLQSHRFSAGGPRVSRKSVDVRAGVRAPTPSPLLEGGQRGEHRGRSRLEQD